MQEKQEPGPSRKRQVTPRRRTVLVVDDEPRIRRSLCDLINAFGFETAEAENGEAALEVCGAPNCEIGLVLLDLLMPGISGEETLIRLAELQPHLPVVLCHGGDDDALSPASSELVAGALRKPFQVDGLESLLASLLPPILTGP